MNNYQNPFSLYDILGYLVPGFLFITGLVFLCTGDGTLLGDEHFKQFIEMKAFSSNSLLLIVVVSYLIGHTLSYLSSMTIEKYSNWTVDFPSIWLLKSTKKRDASWINSHIKNYFLPPADRATKTRIQLSKLFFLRLLLAVTLLPLIFPLFLAYLFFNVQTTIDKGIDNTLRKNIKKRIQRFNKKYNILNQKESYNESFDNFRLIYHYVIEHCPIHTHKLQNYVALYGFARTMSLIFVTLAWVNVSQCWKNGFNIDFVWLLLFNMGMSLIFYMAFNKFYRKFTLETYMGLTSVIA